MKRGLNRAEAIEYVGVKRRTFDEEWRPHLTPMREGSCLVFDRLDLDKLFEQRKAAAADAANDHNGDAGKNAQNGARNGRPMQEEGEHTWARERRGSTPQRKGLGRSTSGGVALDFASAASAVMRKRSAG